MSTAVIIQARMTSSRLPGKVLRPILGRPMLSYQIERLRQARGFDRLVVATTIKRTDDVVAEFCRAEGLDCYRGSENDVLARYYEAAVEAAASEIVRVTSDCPLLDPEVVERVIATFRDVGCDYASNMLQLTFPYGMAVEVMSFAALREAHSQAQDPVEREHVTPYIYRRPEQFRIESVEMTPNRSDHRWTVDTVEDFTLVARIFEALYPANPNFRMDDVVALLETRPDWREINRHVRQVSIDDRPQGSHA
jgi:spore coat polysaccharide biosynthesis protein SpsF